MTQKEIEALAAAIAKVASANECHQLTLRAVVQSINRTMFSSDDRLAARTFRTAATGCIDMTGRDYITTIGATE